MIPKIDFEKLAIQNWPPYKRLPNWMAFIKALVSPLVWSKRTFDIYMNGGVAVRYNATYTYPAGYKVVYKFKVYESLISGNIGNTPNTSPTAWIKISDYHIGATERIKMNGRYLTFTYALNRHFNTTFRQPPYPPPYDFGTGSGTFSDIYITTDPPDYATLGVTDAPQHTGEITSFPLAWGVTDTAIITTATHYKYTIHVPIAVFNELATTDPARESIVRDFADKYNPVGLQYNILTY